MIEDKLPGNFKRVAYHPSAFVFAWKRNDLEKLFEELSLSNIAILSVEAWLVEEGKVVLLIPLRSGNIDTYFQKNKRKEGEEFSDFVERSIKETIGFINYFNLEKNILREKIDSLWYNFEFVEQS